jgi:hypothetical protein
MIIKNVKIVLLILFLFSGKVFSQYMDMDAGITVMGERNPEITDKVLQNKILLNYNVGFSGKDAGSYTTNYLTFQGDFQLHKLLRVFVSVPYGFVSSSPYTVHGFGDMILGITGYLPIPGIGILGLFAGGKFSSGSADKDGLQQAYQPGHGQNDLLIGIGSNSGLVNFWLGYQKPFGRSNNSVTEMKRGDDMMLRFGYTVPYRKTTFQAEIIAIKMLQKENVRVIGSNPVVYTDVDGSNEFQVNMLGKITHMVSPKTRLELYAAYPLLKRNYNLDGLRRTFSVAATVAYRFDMDFVNK